MEQLIGWGRETSPFHQGEQELQDRLGLKERQEEIGKRILRPFLLEQHREFYNQLPFFVVGSVDEQSSPWASVVFGKPGFVSTPTDRRLRIEGQPVPGDPLLNNRQPGAPIGFLGIELAARRRNRVNGVAASCSDDGFEVDVVQSFGNCPQYIQTRAVEFIREPNDVHDVVIEPFDGFDDVIVSAISAADTFFVASHNPIDDEFDNGGVDVSHRGGQPGFVKVDGNVLTIPDYVGNFAFNTFGNFLLNPKAGLLFIDFTSGDIIQLTGTVELFWEPTPDVTAFRGAERSWKFTLEHGVTLKNACPLRWSFDSYSPNTLLTGDWQQAKSALTIEQSRESWRSYNVMRIVDESEDIRSFYLEPADGEALFKYEPGQFLPIRVPSNDGSPMVRTYTLSSSPTDKLYRISVKKETSVDHPDGVVSNYLHHNLKPGDTIEAKAPRGSFVFDTQAQRPAVLIAGGVGITPMISMARASLTDGVRFRYKRPLTVIQVTRHEQGRAFKESFEEIERLSDGEMRYLSVVTQPDETDAGYDFSGRLSQEMLQRILPLADYDFYLCGPFEFLQSTYEIISELGVTDSRIFTESFGPSSLRRRDEENEDVELLEEADSAVVTFSESKFEQAWTPDQGSLLDFAENHGLSPNFACRNGVCGTCSVRLKSGSVMYTDRPAFEPAEGEVLICCATPAKANNGAEIELEL